MKNIGMGSALALLIFSTLCLALLAISSLSTALASKALADVSAQTVTDYYDADALAENILAKILEAEAIPSIVQGVPIGFDTDTSTATICCPISEERDLYVEAVILEDSYSILQWRVRHTGEWEVDNHLPVWLGE